MKHRQTKLSQALLALAMTASAHAGAVALAQDGLGQVLIYPYYTVRSVGENSFATLLSIVNTRGEAKALKVRVRESRTGASVFDFNLFLSPYDVWTAAIVPTSNAAKLITTDVSCVLPAAIPASGIEFRNDAYVSDPVGGSVDRTREGYIEVLEMGVVASGSPTSAAVIHVNGKPGCKSASPGPLNDQDAQADVSLPPGGGLFGNSTLINVAMGTDYHIAAVGLAHWRNEPMYVPQGSPRPDLDDVQPRRSVVRYQEQGVEKLAVTGSDSDWGGTNPVDAVSAVLMHATAQEEFVLDASIAASTDWLINFPTKRFYYHSNLVATPYAPTALFQRSIDAGGACEDFRIATSCSEPSANPAFDREEFMTSPFCGLPPPASIWPLCWASGVLAFGSSSSDRSNVLASAAPARRNLPFLAGWMRLDLWPLTASSSSAGAPYPGKPRQLTSSGVPTLIITPTTGSAVTNTSATYFGLPAIGFAATSYSNGLLTAPGISQPVLANYGEARMTRNENRVVSP
jgi:hypothetical protein